MRRLLYPKKAFFTEAQFQRISSICDNAGQVLFGMLVIGPFFTETSINVNITILGIVTVFMSWGTSLLLAKRGWD